MAIIEIPDDLYRRIVRAIGHDYQMADHGYCDGDCSVEHWAVEDMVEGWLEDALEEEEIEIGVAYCPHAEEIRAEREASVRPGRMGRRRLRVVK